MKIKIIFPILAAIAPNSFATASFNPSILYETFDSLNRFNPNMQSCIFRSEEQEFTAAQALANKYANYLIPSKGEVVAAHILAPLQKAAFEKIIPNPNQRIVSFLPVTRIGVAKQIASIPCGMIQARLDKVPKISLQEMAQRIVVGCISNQIYKHLASQIQIAAEKAGIDKIQNSSVMTHYPVVNPVAKYLLARSGQFAINEAVQASVALALRNLQKVL